jgi:hypothetical protein
MFDQDPVVSAQRRSEAFRRYHHDTCPTCRRDTQECRNQRIEAVLRELKKDGDYLEPDAFRRSVDVKQCRAPQLERDYSLVLPDWWVG